MSVHVDTMVRIRLVKRTLISVTVRSDHLVGGEMESTTIVSGQTPLNFDNPSLMVLLESITYQFLWRDVTETALEAMLRCTLLSST